MDDSDRSRDEPSDHEDSEDPNGGGDQAAPAAADPGGGNGDGDADPGPMEADDADEGDEERQRSDVDTDDEDDADVENDEDEEVGAGDAEGDDEEDADAEGDDEEDADAEGDDEDEEAFGGIEGPETDEEMPLAAHIEEMMRRLAVVFLFGGLATLVVVTESTALINYFWNYHIPAPTENRPRLYGPLELPLTRLKVAGIAGVVVGLPAFVYQTYRFMKPGLYENERRYYLAAVPTSLVLGSIGVAFAHFLVLPAIFSYFTTYTEDAAVIAFGLAETFNLIVVMLAFMAIVFQIPLFIMLAIMMNLVTREWLEDKRLIFWGVFLGIAFIFSPDPTGMAPIIVTLTMIVLYEGTLAILRWTGN